MGRMTKYARPETARAALVVAITSLGGIGLVALGLTPLAETQSFESLRLHGDGTPGFLVVANAANEPTIRLTGVDGRTRTRILDVTGGADIAEPFDVLGRTPIDPGMVVSIDATHLGELRLADRPYDHTVAGVVSGANGLAAGLTLRHEGSAADGKVLVALTGRVYCFADASNGSIEPGDLLTTSATPGHAMKATDRAKAHGAVIGKAMSSLRDGKGLVLVLVNLQ